MIRRLTAYLVMVAALVLAVVSAKAQNPLQNNGSYDEQYLNNDGTINTDDPNYQFYSQQDSLPKVDASTIPVHVDMWTVTELLGNITPVAVDTTYKYYYNSYLEEGRRSTYSYLGNLGSPRYSRVFFDRRDVGENLFLTPYSFYKTPGEFRFVNTKSPYTNLQYYKGGSKHEGEELFKAYFGLSANKHFSTGFDVNYLYGRGYYQAQSTAHLNGAYFASYVGDRYELNFVFNYFRIKMRENGGITDDNYILDPVSMNEGKKEYTSSDIPIRFADNNAWNTNKTYYAYLTHRYKMGFSREVEIPVAAKSGADSLAADSVQKIKEFVPVTSIIHTVKFEKSKRNFLSYGVPADFFENEYMPGDTIDDQFNYMSVKNTVGLAMLEGFNKWAKFGITAFASYELSRFTMVDSMYAGNRYAMRKYTRHDFAVGGEISKSQGDLLHYRARGEISLLGNYAGDFDVSGNIDLNFRLFGDTVQLKAGAGIKNTSPYFYYEHYHSKNFWWDNDFGREWRYRIDGELTVKNWRTNLKVGVENVKNFLYFDRRSLAAQHTGNVQVFAAKLRQDFKLGIFHLDNEIAYQKSSNDDVLPLPAITTYHNLYLSATIAKKVLRVEIGADLRYFTSYYADAYNPATGQFHLQASDDRVKVGGYPMINVYVNLFLKRTRLFAMMYHINQGMGNRNSFYAPHYPIDPSLFKFGISWNFYD